MIAVIDNSGRLCNRLVLFAHACATALGSRQRFCHLMAKDAMEFAKFDPKILKDHKISCFSKIPGWSFVLRLRQAFYERVRPPDEKKYKEGNERRCKKKATQSMLPHVVLCWWYRDPKSLIRHRHDICRILAPKDEYVFAPKTFVEKVRVNGCLLIGVHVRRGDYREFHDGRYFFSDEQYVRFMKMTRHILPREARFVMVSDEPLDEDFFRRSGLDASVFQADDFREDLVLLSFCDYVLGPWSTFSWWAAYYGGGKLCHLHNSDDVIDSMSFRNVTGEEV